MNILNSVIFSIARRELRGGHQGIGLLIACLALGVATIATVQNLAASAQISLKNQGKEILGGEVAISTIYSQVDSELKEWLTNYVNHQSQVAELRTMARNPANNDAVLVEFKAVDRYYPLTGGLQVNGKETHADLLNDLLSKSNDKFGVLVDNSLLSRLNLKLNDQFYLGNEIVEIRGVIDREPDRASSTGAFGLGSRVLASDTFLQASGLVQYGSLVYYQWRFSLLDTVNLDNLRSQLKIQFPEARWQWRDHRDAAPRIALLIERLSIFLTLIGLTALLVGGVGISSAVRSFLDGKARNLALLKCLGASYTVIFWSYFLQILLVMAIGIFAGLAVGCLMPWIIEPFIRPFMPITIHPTIDLKSLLLAASLGGITAITFGLIPLFRQRGISASSALRSQIILTPTKWRAYEWLVIILLVLSLGLLSVLPTSRPLFALNFLVAIGISMIILYLSAQFLMYLSRVLTSPEQFKGAPGLRLALSQLHRPNGVTATVVISLGLGLTVMVAVAVIEGNVRAQISRELPEKVPLFFLVDVQRDQVDNLVNMLTNLEGVQEIASMPYLRGRITEINGQAAETQLINPDYQWLLEGDRGVTYAAGEVLTGALTTGQWWTADDVETPLLSVHGDLVRGFGLKVGDIVTVNLLGRDITATVANTREQDWRAMQLNFTLIFSPFPLNQSPHTVIATITGNENQAGEIQRRLSQDFPNITAIRVKEALQAADQILGVVATAVRVNGGVAILAGVLVLASALAAGQQRRRQDLIVFKLLGANRKQMMMAFLWEYGLLGFIAAFVACMLGVLGAWLIVTQVMQAPWIGLWTPVIMVILGGIGVSLLFGVLSIWRLLSQPSGPLLRNEG